MTTHEAIAKIRSVQCCHWAKLFLTRNAHRPLDEVYARCPHSDWLMWLAQAIEAVPHRELVEATFEYLQAAGAPGLLREGERSFHAVSHWLASTMPAHTCKAIGLEVPESASELDNAAAWMAVGTQYSVYAVRAVTLAARRAPAAAGRVLRTRLPFDTLLAALDRYEPPRDVPAPLPLQDLQRGRQI